MSDGRTAVIYLVSTLRQTGPTNQLLNIVRFLDRSRFAPRIITLSPEPAMTMLPAFQALEVPVASASLTRWQAIMRRDWRGTISRLTGGTLPSPSVLHSQGIRADTISANHLEAVPRLATVRNYPGDDYVMKYGALTGRLMARGHLKAMRTLPYVIACSSTLADRLRRQGVSTRIILNGVDTARFFPANSEMRIKARQELGFDQDVPTVVCLGALAPRKDPTTIIRAIRSRPELDINVLFVGDGPLERACRDAAHDDPRIRLAGHREDVTTCLQSSDILVSASRAEGLPNAVLEALASGLRVVLSDIGPHTEILQRLPFTGRTFRLGDAEELVQALVEELTRGHGFSQSEQMRISTELGAERMSAEYQDLYASIGGNAA